MRGRAWVALVLLGFVLIGAGVIWRRGAGIAQQRELARLEQRRQQLTALHAQLEVDIRDASSRGKLAPIAESRLHLHVPSDTQVIILPRPTRTP